MKRPSCRPLLCAALLVLPALARADWPHNGRIASPYGDQELLSACPNDSGGALLAWDASGGTVFQDIAADGAYANGWPSSGISVPPLWFNSGHYAVNLLGMTPDHAGGAYFALFAGDSCLAECGGDPGTIHAQRVAGPNRLATGWSSDGVRAFDTRVASPGPPVSMTTTSGHGVQMATLTDGSILVQSVDETGNVLWGDTGIELAQPRPATARPVAVGDGEGGMIVFWAGAAHSGDVTRVYGQHVSAEGKLLWGASGMPVTPSLTNNQFLNAVSDGSRGAIVTWSDGEQLFATRVTPGRSQPWGAVVLASRSSARPDFTTASDDRGGVLVAWIASSHPGERTVHAQHLSHGGKLAWGVDGAIASAALVVDGFPAIVSDGRDGAYIAWADGRDAIDLAAQHVLAQGAVDPAWPATGLPVSGRQIRDNGLGIERSFVEQTTFVAGPAGQPILAWQASRSEHGNPVFFDFDYAMRIGPDGPAATPILPVASRAQAIERAATTPAATALSIRLIRSASAASPLQVAITLPASSPAQLDVLDVSGRRVLSRRFELQAGEHEVALFDRGHAPSGVCFARLTQGGSVAMRRIVVVR